MRKIVRNPIKMRIERPDYKKFKVADLGINIVENPKRSPRKPKEYTIMETSIERNPVYSRSRMGAVSKEKNIKVIVFSQNISGLPYTCFSDGKTDACLPLEWQMTGSVLARMIAKSGRKAATVQSEISKGSSTIQIPEGDFRQILKDAERYGKVMQKDRQPDSSAGVEDVIDCGDLLVFRYLSSSLIH